MRAARLAFRNSGKKSRHPMCSLTEELDLTTHEAEALFDLLDFDKSGTIDADQFIMGCIRIHGGAKAIDLVTLMSEVHLLHRRWDAHAAFVEQELRSLSGSCSALMFERDLSSSSFEPSEASPS